MTYLKSLKTVLLIRLSSNSLPLLFGLLCPLPFLQLGKLQPLAKCSQHGGVIVADSCVSKRGAPFFVPARLEDVDHTLLH
jgi:hypothetical protein